MRHAHHIIAAPTTATPKNTGSCPSRPASAPSTGPNIAPATAAAMPVPISSPRRSRGAAPMSHASAPAHEAAPPSPWTNRAMSSTTMLEANANTTLAATIIPSPSSTVGRTPTRDAIQPPGSAPMNVPAGYAAARIPAAVFDRSYWSLSSGSSGVTAA